MNSSNALISYDTMDEAKAASNENQVIVGFEHGYREGRCYVPVDVDPRETATPEGISALYARLRAEYDLDEDSIQNAEADANKVSIKERPAYKVFEVWTTVEEHGKVKPGVWFFGIKETKNESIPTKQFICSPLYVDAVTSSDAGDNFGRLIRFRNTNGTWRTWAMPMELLKGSGEELRGALLDMGAKSIRRAATSFTVTCSANIRSAKLQASGRSVGT
jgi:hypothetical protein